ncbi:phage tail protein [Persephonella sp.]
MFGAYGHIAFEVFGVNPKSIKERLGRRKIRHNVINTYPIIEDTGQTTREIEMVINIAKPFSDDPNYDFQELVDLMNDNETEALVIGEELLGNFTIEKIEKQAEYAPSGQVVKITANIKFLEVKDVD